jgi:hypothetical protein
MEREEEEKSEEKGENRIELNYIGYKRITKVEG